MNQHHETAELIDGAADHIEKYGHHKGSGFAGSGGPVFTAPACIMGALVATRLRLDLTLDPQARAARAAIKAVLPSGISIPSWNDAPERTKQEVLDALRLAAKNERILTDGVIE